MTWHHQPGLGFNGSVHIPSIFIHGSPPLTPLLLPSHNKQSKKFKYLTSYNFILLSDFIQFGCPASHPIFSDPRFNSCSIFQIFWDFSKVEISKILTAFILIISFFSPAQLENFIPERYLRETKAESKISFLRPMLSCKLLETDFRSLP